MSEAANHSGNEPWLSLETASWWFDKSSILLAGTLFIGFICTVIIILTGIAKEHHWDLLRERAAQKITAVEAESAKAIERAAKADERAANAIERAANAELETVKIRKQISPRHLTKEQQDWIASQLSELDKQKGSIQVAPWTPDSDDFWFDIKAALWKGGWTLQGLPTSQTPIVTAPVGVVIFHRPPTDGNAAASKLAELLNSIGIEAHTRAGMDAQFAAPDDTIAIVINVKR